MWRQNTDEEAKNKKEVKMLTMAMYRKGTIARCNECNEKFELSKDCRGYEFGKDSTVRINDFDTCPKCGRFDCHWIFKIDIKEGI
mgnify:CR=1 FL=1